MFGRVENAPGLSSQSRVISRAVDNTQASDAGGGVVSADDTPIHPSALPTFPAFTPRFVSPL
jgi:hypothetical protein